MTIFFKTAAQNILMLIGITTIISLYILTTHFALSDFPILSNYHSRVLILSVNFGADAPLYKRTSIRNHYQYATRHGYKYKVRTTRTNQDIPAFAEKVWFIYDELTSDSNGNYDYIMWIDRDAIFVDHKFWAWINSGVILIKNTRFSKDFIERWKKTIQAIEIYYDNTVDYITIANEKRIFRDLFDFKTWSCQDQGALNAILAGFDYANEDHKWNIDKYNGIGTPHILHKGTDSWAILSNNILLDARYKTRVRVIGEKWLNLNPGDMNKLSEKENNAFIFHFNGQKNKLQLMDQYLPKVRH
eukprot:598451_1